MLIFIFYIKEKTNFYIIRSYYYLLFDAGFDHRQGGTLLVSKSRCKGTKYF